MSTVVWEWGFNLYDRYSQIFSLYAYQKGEKKSGEFEGAMGGCLLIIGNNRRFFIVSWCSKRVTRCNVWELSANSHNGSCEVRRAWNPSGSPSKLIFVWEKSEVGCGTQNPGSKVERTGVGQRMTSYYLKVQRWSNIVTPVVSGRMWGHQEDSQKDLTCRYPQDGEHQASLDWSRAGICHPKVSLQ